MDILILGAILIIVAPIVLAIIAMVKVSSLSKRVNDLETGEQRQLSELKRLREALGAPSIAMDPVATKSADPVVSERGDLVAEAVDTSLVSSSVSKVSHDSAVDDESAKLKATHAKPKQPKSLSRPAPKRSLEEQMGTRWAVWIGGLALALGGIFLIRYSIEAGMFGPEVRLSMAVLLGFVLLAAGEFFRRREMASPISGLDDAAIPPILTSAGIATLFGSAYSAYALYGFIGSGVAFALMAIVAMVALGAALLHGPFLAGAGFLGAYATPILASSGGGSIPALYLYLIAITIPVIILARVRLWYWLMLATIVATLAWAFLTLLDSSLDDSLAHALYLVALGVLFAGGLYWKLHSTILEVNDDRPHDYFAIGAFAALLAVSYLHYVTASSETSLLVTCGFLVALQIGIAWQWSAARAQLVIAGIFGLLVLLSGPQIVGLVAEIGTIASWSVITAYGEQRTDLIIKALLLAALFAVPALVSVQRNLSRTPAGVVWWAAAGTVVPLLTLAVVYLVLNQLEPSMPFALAALVLGVMFAWVARGLLQGEAGRGLVTAIYIVAGLAAAALSLTILLDRGWLTVALALTALGAAYTASRLNVWQVGPAAAVFGILVAARLFYDPLVVGADVGETPIFNWLLWGYGVPAICFLLGARYLRQIKGALLPSLVLDALSMIAVAALAGLQIRHLMNSGSILTAPMDLAEISVHTLMALSLSIGYGRLSVKLNNKFMKLGSLLLSALGLILMVLGLGGRFNPVFSGEPVGEGYIFNLLTLGYLLPGLMTMWLAREAILLGRSQNYVKLARGVGGAVLFLWLNLVIRHFWHGSNMSGLKIFDGEFYAYSAMWLSCGIILLLVGIRLKNELMRKLSGGLILLAVIKIFVFDAAQLEGVLRALSFIGLGAVLIGIAMLYQKLLPSKVKTVPAEERPEQ